MPHNISHFAIHADDIERARAFYEEVFGWRFEEFGPPDFYRIHTGSREDPGIHGALQKRSEHGRGPGMRGFECTISIDDFDGIRDAVVAHGGKITYPDNEIPGVGRLFQFEDPEGNVLCAMQYEPGRERPSFE